MFLEIITIFRSQNMVKKKPMAGPQNRTSFKEIVLISFVMNLFFTL